ncbi:hypothetical protein AB0K02_14645 [Streptomyces sp. NPDC049597]|uniref:hypothetical protein n=1 Tax=Streptomyces sp. NPDC049597 TaxID=3155276 RepID=UPI00342079AB
MDGFAGRYKALCSGALLVAESAEDAYHLGALDQFLPRSTIRTATGSSRRRWQVGGHIPGRRGLKRPAVARERLIALARHLDTLRQQDR